MRIGLSFRLPFQFSSHTHDNQLQDYQLPEISRVGIEELVLQVLVLDLGQPCSFLARALTAPTCSAMKSALKRKLVALCARLGTAHVVRSFGRAWCGGM